MRDAVEKALRYPQGSSRQGLEDDEILRLAITELVDIVGEAACPGSHGHRAPASVLGDAGSGSGHPRRPDDGSGEYP